MINFTFHAKKIIVILVCKPYKRKPVNVRRRVIFRYILPVFAINVNKITPCKDYLKRKSTIQRTFSSALARPNILQAIFINKTSYTRSKMAGRVLQASEASS